MACHIAGYNITQINSKLKPKGSETAEFCIFLGEIMHKNKDVVSNINLASLALKFFSSLVNS